jgi:cytochrome c-type biogenesis protein CcmH
MRVFKAVLAISLMLGAAAPAWASPEDIANDIASDIMSPFCPGVTLHDCPSDRAIELRQQIVEWAEAGWSRDRIMEELVDDYGPQIRAAPPVEGTGLLAWILPGVAVIAGGAGALLAARRWARRSPDGTPTVVSDADRARLRAELDQMRQRS